MINRLLFAVVVFLWAFGTSAQLFNPTTSPPFSGVFGNPGTPPIPFFNQTAAVNYNYGGQGHGYNVPSPHCVGITCAAGASAYRADAINFKASTFGSGFNWLLAFNTTPNAYNYTISISQPGPYSITLWAGSPSTGGSWNILIDNTLVGNVPTIPTSGGYDTQTASTSAVFNSTIGTHTLTLAWGSGDVNGSPGDVVAWQGQQATQPGTVACDIGPTYSGTIPAAAVQAGFTHCAANYDFTQTASFTNSGHTYQWSNTASWFTCSKPNVNTYLWYYNGDVACDTSHLNIQNDSSGVQTWALSHYSSDATGTLAPQTAQDFGSFYAISFPTSYYVEHVFQPSTTSACNGFCAMYVISSLAVRGTPTTWCSFGGDFDEVAGNTPSTVNTALSGWNFSCTNTGTYEFGPPVPSESPAPSTSSYTTYGALLTADGSNNVGLCNYYRAGDVRGLTAADFRSCVNPPWSIGSVTTTAAFNQVMYFYLGNPFQLGSNWTASSETTNIRRITIWVCPGGDSVFGSASNECFNNPVITAHP